MHGKFYSLDCSNKCPGVGSIEAPHDLKYVDHALWISSATPFVFTICGLSTKGIPQGRFEEIGLNSKKK